MKVLHITPHLGGGVGTVIMDWMDKEPDENSPIIMSLDYVNKKAISRLENSVTMLLENCAFAKDKTIINQYISSADIVLVHYWDHPMLADLFADPIPDCRLVFWCHKNITVTMFNPVWWDRVLNYPDRFINASPIQGCGCEHIWSTGNMDRFLAIEPKPHEGFNIGYVGTVDYKKIHTNFLAMCLEIMKHIPDVHFTVVGKQNIGITEGHDDRFTFTGKVDDVVPYLAEMDVFGYPLRSDHYGTCEIVLGEAMAAGVVPVVMDNPAERLIIGGEPGIVVGGGLVSENEKGFIFNVEYLYRNLDTRICLSFSTKERSRKLYSIDTMIQQWNDVFAEMMQKPKTRKEALK